VYWARKFDRTAARLGRTFARRASTAIRFQMAQAGQAAGLKSLFKVRGQSRRANDVFQSVVAENVSLIKTISQQYHAQVETVMMQGIQNGRDLNFISTELDKRYDITDKRARMIARDQTNKSCEVIARQECDDAGITEGLWMHRAGAKKPRPAHVEMNGTRFNLKEGCFDEHEGRNVFPSELVNCRCTWKPVLPERMQ
jgi:SPP1 gp7 family putative phage head morphogenesis protein